MQRNRVKSGMSKGQIVAALADGNPGAMSSLVQTMSVSDIDPDSVWGELTPAFHLDSFGIYGSDIYILFSDICRRDARAMWAVLRATQMGLFDASVLQNAAGRQDRSGREMVPVEELMEQVKIRLPSFGRELQAEI